MLSIVSNRRALRRRPWAWPTAACLYAWQYTCSAVYIKMRVNTRFNYTKISLYLATFIGFANVIHIALASIMIFAGYDWIHTTSFTFEHCRDGSVSATALDLYKPTMIN